MSDGVRLSWGHVNINVSDLDRSIEFYSRLGFRIAIPGIPYLGLAQDDFAALDPAMCEVMALPAGTLGRACIMQLGDGLPMIDLIQLADVGDVAGDTPAGRPRGPLDNGGIGLVRLCLATRDLPDTVDRLRAASVDVVSPVRSGHQELADVARCRDPDGTSIELIQIHLERWSDFL